MQLHVHCSLVSYKAVEFLRQELTSFIKHKAVVNVKLRCFQSTRKLQSWFSVKGRQALLNRFNFALCYLIQSDVVFCFVCKLFSQHSLLTPTAAFKANLWQV